MHPDILVRDGAAQGVLKDVHKEVAQLILSDPDYLSQDNLNVNEDLINFQNGLLHVSGDSVSLLPHTQFTMGLFPTFSAT